MSRTVAVIITTAFLVACGPGEMSNPAPIGGPKSDDPNLQLQAQEREAEGTAETGGCGICPGCCQNGVCVTGIVETACGYGGLECDICTGNERCVGNTCQANGQTTPEPKNPAPEPESDCGPDNCDGCCDSDGKCQENPVFPLCGDGGYKCDECSDDQICSNAGVCDDKPAVEYDVVVVSAKIDGGCEGLLSWINDCDPLVRITFDGKSYKTKSDDGDDTPDWNQTLFSATGDELTSEVLLVEVMDDDSLLTFSDDRIGKCNIDVTTDILDDGQVVTDCGDAKNLTIAFVTK